MDPYNVTVCVSANYSSIFCGVSAFFYCIISLNYFDTLCAIKL